MDIALLILRLLLAAVFLVAGFSKLIDLAGSQRALRDFGVPARLSAPFGVLLPLVELAVTVALVPSISAWWGGVGALVLLLLFVAGISYNLARGRTPECHCFGQLHSAPAGWFTLLRNLVLAVLAAVFIGLERGHAALSAVAWIGKLTEAQRLELFGFLLLLAGLLGLGWLVWQMLQQQGRVLLQLEALDGLPGPNGSPVRRTVPMTAASQWNGNGAPGAANASTQPTSAEESIELTIGMATCNDFDGVYFTLQALRLYQDLEHTELLVIDNYGCEDTKYLVEGWVRGRYILAKDVVGTAAPRDLVFREARGNAVLCCDSHVLFPPGVIAQLKQFYREHPDCYDLLQGPMLYDDGELVATHFEPVWRDQMWGTWESDPRGQDPSSEPFEIPMQGLGVFSCLKRAWLGFNPEFRGFGGEEGYIHEKFRQAGRRCLCLPWLRWMHRFSRPSNMKYSVTVEEKLRNYLIGHAELGLDLEPVLQHFSEHLSQDTVIAIADQTLGVQWAGQPAPRQALVAGGSPPAQGANAIRGQVVDAIDLPMSATASKGNGNGVTATFQLPRSLRIGSMAPDFSLPDLTGDLVHLSDFRGHQTLVLFWKPDCGFCQRMLPDLLVWESQPPEDAPRLLVVSTGSVQDNQALGLRSPVVLDQTGMSIGNEFGAVGAPMAILVDAEGKTASELEAGAPAVLALASAGQEKTVSAR